MIDFVGAPASTDTLLLADASPYADVNDSGHLEAGELAVDANRAALRIVGTSGLLDFARFDEPDCEPDTPTQEACMYMLGTMPAQLESPRASCTLPDGSTAAVCIPVRLSPQTLFGTSVRMTAGALGIGIPADTGKSVMRMREPLDHPLEGFIVERDGAPWMTVALELYMDAPDMKLPLAQHDLHSKPLSVVLEGPVGFRADGRIAIALHNVADMPLSVGITAPLGISGAVELVVPAGEMKLQLLSPPQRGRLP